MGMHGCCECGLTCKIILFCASGLWSFDCLSITAEWVSETIVITSGRFKDEMSRFFRQFCFSLPTRLSIPVGE